MRSTWRECGEGLVEEGDEVESAIGVGPIVDGDVEAVQGGGCADPACDGRGLGEAGAFSEAAAST
jgi:hypothetical protein